MVIDEWWLLNESLPVLADLRLSSTAMSIDNLPFPPLELATRTGSIRTDQFWPEWEQIGAVQAGLLRDYLPAEWERLDRRTLDFGCGSGRALRHFVKESTTWEMWGCDIDARSIQWLTENLSPPFHFFEVGNEENSQIPMPDGYFDLIWSYSVFTHITDDWGSWLLELHRVLKPDGLILISFLGKNMIGPLLGEEWNSDRIGMNVLSTYQSWDVGGPTVLHSEWWLRTHWGRAFDVLRLDDEYAGGHGLVLMRKRDVKLTRSELEAIDPRDQREISALRHNIHQLNREARLLNEELQSHR